MLRIKPIWGKKLYTRVADQVFSKGRAPYCKIFRGAKSMDRVKNKKAHNTEQRLE